MERKPGYYWVKAICGGYTYGGKFFPKEVGKWEVAELCDLGWFVEGGERALKDEEFAVIGPRIEPPADSEGEAGR